MENVIERAERLHYDEKIEEFRQKTLLPYGAKVNYAITRVRLYEQECGIRGLNTHVKSAKNRMFDVRLRNTA